MEEPLFVRVPKTRSSIFNAENKFAFVADYKRYTRPYDKRVFNAIADTKLSVLHLHHLERPYFDQFKDFDGPVIQYSVKTSGIQSLFFARQYLSANRRRS